MAPVAGPKGGRAQCEEEIHADGDSYGQLGHGPVGLVFVLFIEDPIADVDWRPAKVDETEPLCIVAGHRFTLLSYDGHLSTVAGVREFDTLIVFRA